MDEPIVSKVGGDKGVTHRVLVPRVVLVPHVVPHSFAFLRHPVWGVLLLVKLSIPTEVVVLRGIVTYLIV